MPTLLRRLVQLGTRRAVENAREACDRRRREDLAVDALTQRLAGLPAAARRVA